MNDKRKLELARIAHSYHYPLQLRFISYKGLRIDIHEFYGDK